MALAPDAANLLPSRLVRLRADNELAHLVLLRILDATGERFSWRLLYDAATNRYELHLRQLKKI